MDNRTKRLLRAAGSVMDLSPTTDYSQYLTQEPDSVRLAGDWARVGKDYRIAITRQGKAAEEAKQK